MAWSDSVIFISIARVQDENYQLILHILAVNIRKHRKLLGMSQETAAQEIGIATRHYQKLEAGQVNATLLTLTKVAEVLKVEIRDLFVPEK